MQPTRFDFDVITGSVPPRTPPRPAPTVPHIASQSPPKPDTGK
jgi:hypothetical protein